MTHDELTNRKIFELSLLRNGVYYWGRCRNASVARWDADLEVFWYWREKAGKVFLESIRHPDQEEIPTMDVFRVISEIPDGFNKFIIPLSTKEDIKLTAPECVKDLKDLQEHNEWVWSEYVEK